MNIGHYLQYVPPPATAVSASTIASSQSSQAPSAVSKYCIADIECIKMLLRSCEHCNERIDTGGITASFSEGVYILRYRCEQCGDQTWRSQRPVSEGVGRPMYEGNILLYAAIHTCGVPLKVRDTHTHTHTHTNTHTHTHTHTQYSLSISLHPSTTHSAFLILGE